ncbi:RAMP superfamily CRISPR-associated protein [uncultured Leptotrichia sp.]|mgnify:FL=1|uniref:RAMP superfamily CRISPR-associated protein n=1 Tax=uncultured Leptotrichia sp. TaxID=159271 RepID=UPI00263031EA|nr:RAMP superfamily CRISPR-associated protein [uncultured Leptotrichia sp.]
MGIKIGYEVELLTPAITAETGTIGKEIDVEVKRDKNGTPYFSAKHMKGVFRAKVLEFKNALNGDGKEFTEKYFGSGGNNPSKIRFSDLKLKIEKNIGDEGYQRRLENKIGNRYGVKINRKTRVAEENSLFNYEFVKPKNIYAGSFELSNDFLEKSEEDIKFLLSSFLHIDKIGGLKSRGLGKVLVQFVSIENDKRNNFKEENDRFKIVEKILKEVKSKNNYKNQGIKKLNELEKYKYTLNFVEPAVLQGKVNKNEVELRKSLQGSSIRGAIIQYGLDNGFESEIEKLLKIKISEVRKFVKKDKNEIKEEFKLASGFKTKYPIEADKYKKIDKAVSVMKEYKVNEEDENGIKLERDSLALLNTTGTELSIKIDEKTRTTEESLLFSTEYTDLTNVADKEEVFFKGNVEIPKGLFEIGKKYELKIGKYKTKGFGKVEIKFEKFSEEKGKNISERIEKLNSQIKEDFKRFDKENNKKVKEERENVYNKDNSDKEKLLKEEKQKLITFDFLSDMILPFNEVSNVGKQILELFDENFGEKLTLNNRRTFVNVEKLRGYNIINNSRKMDEIVITQGSVISYCVDNENLEGILGYLEKIEENGIGLRRNEGFGRVRICSERECGK